MFILSEPYISTLASDFISRLDCSRVLNTSFLDAHPSINSECFISDPIASETLLARDGRWIYSNSENSLSIIDNLFPESHRIKECIELFKNKHLFREEYKSIFPGIDFELVTLDALLDYKYSDFGKPFIIKPSVGFLSAGVYRINSQSELEEVQSRIVAEMHSATNVFPKSVINSSHFLIEGIISGREFAIDAFYTDDNEPVIVNIFEHIFRDEADMSDRLYLTSPRIINDWLKPFTNFLNQLKSVIDLPGFVLHAEVRVDNNGIIRPIEINPLRFAGWCTTDLSYYAYEINPYEHFADRKQPDWDRICSETPDRLSCMSVISSPLVSTANSFDYDEFSSRFSDLKELRKIDYTQFPLFGFAFFSTPENDIDFINWMLNTDFSDFCS